MNTVTIFRGTLPKNFLGNVIYQFQLPCSCTALHIRLICHLQDRKEAAFLHEKEAEAAFLDHCGRLPDAQEKERLLAQMKTEIQLAAFLSGKFLGNVHRPGNIKEMHFPRMKNGPAAVWTKRGLIMDF